MWLEVLFVGIFIFLFERYDAYKMKHVALPSRLLFFIIWMLFITLPLLSTALTAYKIMGRFWDRSSSNSILHDTHICFMDRCDFDVLFKNVSGIFAKFKQPISSLFPGLVLLIGEVLFFCITSKLYSPHRRDELPIFEFSMIFAFPLYVLFIFAFAELHITLVDKFL